MLRIVQSISYMRFTSITICQKLGGAGAGVSRRRKKQFSEDRSKTSGCESKGIGQKDNGRPVF